ncbi:MAG: hypothetical protein JOZ49_11740 [Mycolicibacterium sp.]|nr:hypothetical protein [Mycolicibacterium sp.]
MAEPVEGRRVGALDGSLKSSGDRGEDEGVDAQDHQTRCPPRRVGDIRDGHSQDRGEEQGRDEPPHPPWGANEPNPHDY